MEGNKWGLRKYFTGSKLQPSLEYNNEPPAMKVLTSKAFPLIYAHRSKMSIICLLFILIKLYWASVFLNPIAALVRKRLTATSVDEW